MHDAPPPGYGYPPPGYGYPAAYPLLRSGAYPYYPYYGPSVSFGFGFGGCGHGGGCGGHGGGFHGGGGHGGHR